MHWLDSDYPTTKSATSPGVVPRSPSSTPQSEESPNETSPSPSDRSSSSGRLSTIHHEESTTPPGSPTREPRQLCLIGCRRYQFPNGYVQGTTCKYLHDASDERFSFLDTYIQYVTLQLCNQPIDTQYKTHWVITRNRNRENLPVGSPAISALFYDASNAQTFE